MMVVFVAVVVAALFLWLANGVRKIGAVSQGPRVGGGDQTALLLIDLQTVFWDHGPYSAQQKTQAKARILEEIAQARDTDQPIIEVRQEWSIPSTKVIARVLMKGQAIAGTPGTEIAAPFAGKASHQMVKRVQDAFETGELDAVLQGLNVGKLRIVGLDFNHCVLKTALAAGNRGYDVEIIKDATLAAADVKASVKWLQQARVALG